MSRYQKRQVFAFLSFAAGIILVAFAAYLSVSDREFTKVLFSSLAGVTLIGHGGVLNAYYEKKIKSNGHR